MAKKGNPAATTKKDKPAKVEKTVVEKTVVEKIEQNGVTRPKAGTQTGRVWELADSMSAAKGEPVERATLLEATTAEKINAATASTQFGRWCKFYGMTKAKTQKPAKAEETDDADAGGEEDDDSSDE